MDGETRPSRLHRLTTRSMRSGLAIRRIVPGRPPNSRAETLSGDRRRPTPRTVRHHVGSEGHQHDRNQLEGLDAEGDPDDRDAQDHAADEAVHGEPQAAEDDPDDVADDVQGARHAGAVFDVPSERPQREARQLEGLDAERDRDDQDEHHDPRDDERDREPDPHEDEPENVADGLHAAPYLSGGAGLGPGSFITVAPRSE